MNIIKEINNYKEITEFLDNSEKSKRLKRLIKKQMFQKFKRELKRRIYKMRKSNYLQLSENKDRESYNLLLNCCHVSRSHLNEYISNNRINAYLKEKLIERIQTKDRECFRLTDKGYKRFEKEIGSSHFRYHSRSIEHDLKLSDKYIEIMRDRNNEWKNEEDLKQERKQILDSLREEGRFHDMERLSMCSVPDCVISSDISYGFDIITDNYSNSQIESKEEYCELMNLECKFEKI